MGRGLTNGKLPRRSLKGQAHREVVAFTCNQLHTNQHGENRECVPTLAWHPHAHAPYNAPLPVTLAVSSPPSTTCELDSTSTEQTRQAVVFVHVSAYPGKLPCHLAAIESLQQPKQQLTAGRAGVQCINFLALLSPSFIFIPSILQLGPRPALSLHCTRTASRKHRK